jgi:hypothetical protein
MLRTLAVASLLLFACGAHGQPAAPRPEFEVASIKLNKSASFGAMLRPGPGGRFSATNIPLQLLVTFAYKIKDFQLSGAPPWLMSERYDIEAKATAFCGGFMMFPGHLSGQKVTIEQLLDPLSRFTGQTVLDKTNLTGKYDVDVQYTPEQGQFQTPPPGAPGMPQLPPIDPNGPSLFTALQEQLGLKLESQKGPVEIIVVDHIERPSEN